MVPDPVALRPLLEQRYLILQVFFDHQQDLTLCYAYAILFGCGFVAFFSLRSRLFVGCSQLCGEDMLENDAAVVPYCVVFWVLVEQAGGELERGVGVVAGVNLNFCLAIFPILSAIDSSHLLRHLTLECLVLLDMFPLLLPVALALVCNGGAGNAVLFFLVSLHFAPHFVSDHNTHTACHYTLDPEVRLPRCHVAER